MKFFLPDWDDRVDPGFDFLTDRFTLVRDPYRDDRYAHELLQERVYDGVLVSRMVLAKAGPKRALVDRIGMRAYLRLPSELELLGDCGAFGYIREKVPPYESREILDYYEANDFDYGVSIDHIIVPEFAEQRDERFALTLRNAEEFLRLHRAGRYRFTPIGAVQGWDAASYIASAQQLIAMGYDYIALGGLARSNTRTVREMVSAVADAIPKHVRLHVFGVARAALLPLFLELGIASVDSAAPLRQAWLDASDNYYTPERTYTAIRIPVSREERPKAQSLVGRSDASFETLRDAESQALDAVRAYARRERALRATLDAIMVYDELLAKRLDGQSSARRRELYRETLTDRPWQRCRCAICRDLGVEVIIFRGNNRNRRRGFHNLSVLRHRIGKLKSGRQGASPTCANREVAAPLLTALVGET